MKTLLVFLLFFFSIQTYSQIKAGGSIELGYEDRLLRFNDNTGSNHESFWLNNKEFADIKIDINSKNFTIQTNVKTYFACEKIYMYIPFQVEYKIGANYKIKCFTFSVEHLCSHSVESLAFYEAYDRISLKIKLF